MTKKFAPLIGALLAISLTGCVAPPQPFAPPNAELLAELPSIQSIGIDLSGFSQTTNLEYALTGALGAHDLPAYIGTDAPKGSYRLAIDAPIAPATKAEARLADPKGQVIAQFELDLAKAADARALARATDGLAVQIAQKVIPTDPNQATVPDARVSVMIGQGATGDGNEALAEAMIKALRGRVPLDAAPSTENYVITARVNLNRQGGYDIVAVVWLILDSKGREAARLAQVNPMPVGSLDKGWGKVAEQAAGAAAEALIPVLGQLPASSPK